MLRGRLAQFASLRTFIPLQSYAKAVAPVARVVPAKKKKPEVIRKCKQRKRKYPRGVGPEINLMRMLEEDLQREEESARDYEFTTTDTEDRELYEKYEQLPEHLQNFGAPGFDIRDTEVEPYVMTYKYPYPEVPPPGTQYLPGEMDPRTFKRLARQKLETRRSRITYEKPISTQYHEWNTYIPPQNGYTVETFLKAIGKLSERWVSFFPTWEDLFLFTTKEVKWEIPVNSRRWIWHWREKYKHGIMPYRTPLRSKARKNVTKKGKW